MDSMFVIESTLTRFKRKKIISIGNQIESIATRYDHIYDGNYEINMST